MVCGRSHPAVQAVQRGAQHYLVKPVDPDVLGTVIAETLAARREAEEIRALRRSASTLRPGRRMIGESFAFRRLMRAVQQVAASRASVLIEGETGTGKELVAQAIRDLSDRADSAYITLNCAALPEGLIESALFGHERGAFTGAVKRSVGAFERANGGTLLLDEISEMPLALQAKLLRVLETRQFRRVGGTRDISVNVRMISMTNKDLETAVARGEFRQDLYYRLKVISVRMPALREHPADAVLLAQHFLQRFAQEFNHPLKKLSPEAQEALLRYGWPGNVRELRNAIERIVLLEAGEVVLPKHLPAEIQSGAARGGRRAVELPAEGVKLEDVERELVRLAVERAGGNQTQAAELLGIERDALRRRLQKFNLMP